MKSLLTVALLFALVAPVSATTLLFDFGRTDTQTMTGTWNNVVPATTSLFALFDADGNLHAGGGLEITDTFFQVGEPTANIGSTSPSGDAGVYPVSATSDTFFGHNAAFAGQEPNPLGQLRLFGLDPSQQYNFTFFASRQPVGDMRETMYTVAGDNSGSTLLEPANNDTDLANVMGITPNANGEIFVDVESGPNSTSNFYYLNVMQIDAVVPEPASLLLGLLALGLPVLSCRTFRRS